ncbi:amidase [Vibrio kyushuensis]|uniref:amidase n=1 Tax=Vibrio kyushuensis TaxID=2910249 RepID=UPI003D0DFC12
MNVLKNTDLTIEFDEYISLDAIELANLVKINKLSQQDLVEIVIRRIEAINPKLNFMANTTFDRARERTSSISNSSKFSGLPILIKDMIDIGGVKRTDGSRLMSTNIPKENVDFIEALEASGANILGTTNVPEFACTLTTHNDLYGETINPWNSQYTAFGSSGGSAVAVACGAVPMAHGSDGAGSNRLPASANGVIGMKPSRYRMLAGEIDSGHDIAKTNQMISRTVRDSAAMLDATEDKSGEYYPPMGMVTGSSERRLTIGVIKDFTGLLDVEPAVHASLLSTIELLKSLGHTVVEKSNPIDATQLTNAYLGFFSSKSSMLKPTIEQITGKTPAESGLVTKLLASLLDYNEQFTEQDAKDGVDYFNTLPDLFDELFVDCDIVLTPVSPIISPLVGKLSPDFNVDADLLNYTCGLLKFTLPINFAGNPAMSLPLFWDDETGMPIGNQFIAKSGEDKTIYELAYELEIAKPWKDNWPSVSLKTWQQ